MGNSFLSPFLSHPLFDYVVRSVTAAAEVPDAPCGWR